MVAISTFIVPGMLTLLFGTDETHLRRSAEFGGLVGRFVGDEAKLRKHSVAYAVHKARAGLCGECAFEVHVDATGNRHEGGRARGTLDVPAPRGWDNLQLPWQLDASAIL